MQFDRGGIVAVESRGNLLQVLLYPMGSALEHRDTGEDEVLLIGIRNRAGFIQIQKMHGRGGR